MLNGLEKNLISIGFTKWGSLNERTRELLLTKVKTRIISFRRNKTKRINL